MRPRAPAFAVLLAILACGGDEGRAASEGGASEAPGTGDAEPGPAGAAAGPGGEILTIALRQLPRQLDPLGDLEPWAQRVADDLVFEGLTRRSPAGHPWAEPALADRCELDEEHDARSAVCHLPSGRRFHDGSEVTPDDVVYSLQYWLDPRQAWSRERHGLAALKSVELVDGPRGAAPGERDEGRWVRIGFSRSEPLALERLAEMKIVPRAAHRGRSARFATTPVGSGPMAVVAMADDRWVLERSAQWQASGRRPVALAGLVLQEVGDGAQALSLARRGQAQIVDEVAPAHLPVELGKPAMAERFTAWLLTPPRFDGLVYNFASGLQAGPRLRVALHEAVPRAAIERQGYGAPGAPAEAPVDLAPPLPIDLGALVGARSDEQARGGLPTWRDAEGDAAGAAHAAAELDALSWRLDRGVRRKPAGNLRISVMWDGRAGRAAQVVGLVRDAWRALGIQAPESTAAWGYLMTLVKKGSYEVLVARIATHSDEDLFDQFHSRGENNLSGVSDGQLDAALEAFRAARTPAARSAAKQLVADRLEALRVMTVLHAPAQVMLVSRRVSGVSFEDDLPLLDRLELARDDAR